METTFKDDYDHVDPSLLYTPVNIPGRGCDADLFSYQLSSACTCKSECHDPELCSCLKLHGKNYNDGKLIDFKFSSQGSCVECSELCSCSLNCGNRVVQFGPILGLQINEFTGKGYGIITSKKISKGQFVCEYAGEVISRKEAIKRRKNDENNYIFTLNEFVENDTIETIVDATRISNIGRYINHSCDPNCQILPVRNDSVIPKLAIFALRDINPNEEIMYSYGGKIPSQNAGLLSKPCLCGTSKCKLFLPYEP